MEFRDEHDLAGRRPPRKPPGPEITGFWEGVRWGIGDALRSRRVWLFVLAAAVLTFSVTHG